MLIGNLTLLHTAFTGVFICDSISSHLVHCEVPFHKRWQDSPFQSTFPAHQLLQTTHLIALTPKHLAHPY